MPALEILFPDDAVRNLIRQAKVEQVYSVMQTGTARGMQTMEQSLADLTLRGVITIDTALSRSSRPEQLLSLLERAGFPVPDQSRRVRSEPSGGGGARHGRLEQGLSFGRKSEPADEPRRPRRGDAVSAARRAGARARDDAAVAVEPEP